MKTIIVAVGLCGIILSANAQLETNQPARLKWKIEWFDGTTNSGTCGHAINFQPYNIRVGDTGADIRTSPGWEHELRWTFIGRNNDKDIYRFTFWRMIKAGSSAKNLDSKDVAFDGKRIVVFEDELHTVVMETPSDGDLKHSK